MNNQELLNIVDKKRNINDRKKFKPAQKEVIVEYDEEGEKKYPSLELVRIEKKFFNIHKDSSKILEYGFGGGCNTEALDQGHEIYGIDVSKAALNTTKRRFIGKEAKIKDRLHLFNKLRN